MDEIKLSNGNFIVFTTNYNLKESFGDFKGSITNLEDISILNIPERRKEKTNYSFNSKYRNTLEYNNNDFIFVVDKKTEGVNFMSLLDGSVLLENDILGIIDFKYINGVFFLLSDIGDIFVSNRQHLNFLLISNISKDEFKNINYYKGFLKVKGNEFIYNIESDLFEGIGDMKKDEIIAINNSSVIILKTKKVKYEYGQKDAFIEFSLNKKNGEIIENKIQFISPIHYKLGFGIYIKEDGIYKYDNNNIITKISNKGEKREKIQLNYECSSKYKNINNEYQLLKIDETLYINLSNNSIYKLEHYGDNIYLKDSNGVTTIIRDSNIYTGLYEIFNSSSKRIYRKDNNIYYIYDTREGTLEELNIPGELSFEIISKYDDGSNRGFTILFYTKQSNNLYVFRHSGYNGEKYHGGKLSLIKTINNLGLKDFIANNYKYISSIDILSENFIYLFGNNGQFSSGRGSYIQITENEVISLGIEGNYIKEIKEDIGHFSLREFPFFVLGNKLYIRKDNLIKDIFSFPEKFSISDVNYEKNQIVIQYYEFQGEYNKIKLERTIIIKNDGDIKSYNGGFKKIVPTIKIPGKQVFLTLKAVLLDNNEIILIIGDKEEIIKDLSNITINGDYINGLNVLVTENGDYKINPIIDNIDNIKEIQDFNKEDGILKIIQHNKKEYLTDLFLNKITVKDYNKIIEYRGNKTILVKQSGNIYLSNFGGGIVSHKFSSLILLGQDFYLGSDEGVNYYIYDKNLQKVIVTDKDNQEIVFNGTYEENTKFILSLKNGKKIIFNKVFSNKEIFDDIKILSDEIFKGTQGRDIFHFNVETEMPYYKDRYYDVVGVQGNFLIVEDRRDYLVLNKQGKNITGKSYKEIIYDNLLDKCIKNIIKVMDFNNSTLFIDINGNEYIDMTYSNSYDNYYGISTDGKIVCINSGAVLFDNKDNVNFIKIEHMFNGFKLIDNNKLCYFIDFKGNLIYEKVKDIKTCNGVKFYDIVAFKEGKLKYSIGNSKGEVIEKDIFSDISNIGDDYIRGDISGVNLRYDLKKLELVVGY